MKRILLLVLLSCCLLVHVQARKSLVVGLGEVCSSGSLTAPRTYVDALLEAGHLPILIPATGNDRTLKEYVSKIDVLLLPGGEDVDPAYYHAAPSPLLGIVNGRRDTFEMSLLRETVKQRKPIIGICRGLQVINVFWGGTLYQDLPSEKGVEGHSCPQRIASPVHPILIDRNSRLYGLLGVDSLSVNSSHHQAVKDIAPGLHVVASSPDGVVEAIEGVSYPVAAVQFHPERLVKGSVPEMKILFRQLKKWTCNRKQKR